jgi:hypothetical protein
LIGIKNTYKKYHLCLTFITIIVIFLLFFKINFEYNNSYLLQETKNLKEEISTISTDLNDTLIKINEIKKENIKYLYDPTSEEAYNFILSDKTDQNTYDEEKYNCAHYSMDTDNNAEKNGIRCAYVKINLQSGLPHAIVAFNTTDKGLLFFEPQTDETVYLIIGMDYWEDCVNTTSPKFERNDNNIVLDYEIYW